MIDDDTRRGSAGLPFTVNIMRTKERKHCMKEMNTRWLEIKPCSSMIESGT